MPGRLYLFLTALFFWAASAALSSSPPPASLPGEEAVWNRLMQNFREAHEAENLESIMALSWWEGVTGEYREQVERSTRGSFVLTIVQINIEPWQEANSHLLRRRIAGVPLVGNLDPVAQMRVIYESPRAGARGGVIYSSLLPVGIVEDTPRLIQLRPASRN